MLEYRNTPLDNIGSPAQLLMSRRLNSILATTAEHLQPKTLKQTVVAKGLIAKQSKQKKYYDVGAKPKPNLAVGEKVRILQDDRWNEAKIQKKCESPRSYIVETPSRTYRRNLTHILKMNETSNNDLSTPNIQAEAASPPKATVKTPAEACKLEPYITRYGRCVKPRVLSDEFVTK